MVACFSMHLADIFKEVSFSSLSDDAKFHKRLNYSYFFGKVILYSIVDKN